jgi:ferredoxin-nitrate reductase
MSRPLPPWDSPEAAFDAWRECSRGRPCDYSGLNYDKLRDGPGIQWPCTDEAPNGTDRLYVDHHFMTDEDHCETYGHDLATGGEVSAPTMLPRALTAAPGSRAPSGRHRQRALTTRTRCS